MGHAIAQLVEALRYKSEGHGFDSRWCHWIFALTSFFRPHYGLGVDSASNRNEDQECFPGVKAASAYGWQPYHLSVLIVLKSGSLNLLETSGPLQACNGIALPIYIYWKYYVRLVGIKRSVWLQKCTVWIAPKWTTSKCCSFCVKHCTQWECLKKQQEM